MNRTNLRSMLLRFWLRSLLLFWICTPWSLTQAATGERTYTVRRGDTLSGIALTHGVPLARLTERNQLSVNSRIHPGQRLSIPPQLNKPAPKPGLAPAPAAALPSTVQRAIDRAQVKRGRWKHIVIHHSGVNTGTIAGMDRYHREVRHMENGLAYHFVIGNAHGLGDGQVGIGARWTRQLDGGHLISEAQNKNSIGICLVGNFDNEKPTALQMERLTLLVQALMKRCQLSSSALKTHQQINIVHTRCPGRNFPLQRLLGSLGRQTATAR
jgi:murein DD-endopeptidase MepM/ murein hydrolase activator NlpD